MVIGGFLNQSLAEFPGFVSCVIFTQGCNFRCPFCHNPELIPGKSEGEYSLAFIFDYLKKYEKWLDAVAITGGEPTLHKDLPNVMREIKKMGFKIKLEQNGSNPDMLEKILSENLADFIQMDLKAPVDNYEDWIDCKVDINKIKKSVKLIQKSGINHEFVTTATSWHSDEIISKIRSDFNISKKEHRIQKFRDLKVFNKQKLDFLLGKTG